MIPEPLANGFCFGEGPRWFEGLLWFSDMLGEAVHTADMRGSLTTLPLPGHSPSGLGFRPDGSLLIASTEDRQVLRYDGETVVTIADLADLAPANLGDMVVDDAGRAYIGSQAFSGGGLIVRLDPDDTATVVAENLDFPNGMVITADRNALIVAESVGRRLTEFSIGDAVNIAARVEQINKQFGSLILATESTVRAAGDGFPCTPLGETGVRGHRGDVVVYRIDAT